MNSSDFPVDTLAHLRDSQKKFDQLLRDGQLTEQQASQVLGFFAAWFDANYDTSTLAAPASAVFTGTAGTTTYDYVAIPNYPLNDPTGVIPAVKFLPAPPPFGRPSSLQELEPGTSAVLDLRTRRYPGGSAFDTALAATALAVANCAAVLNATNYVTITAPTPGAPNFAGVLFDICLLAGGKYYLVAENVAAGGTAVDNGQAKPEYVPFAHNEVGWAAGSSGFNAGAATVVYNVNTTLGD